MSNNLYLVERTDRVGDDEFDAMVVCAEDEAQARASLPTFEPMGESPPVKHDNGWTTNASSLRIRRIGKAAAAVPVGCVLSSFIAG